MGREKVWKKIVTNFESGRISEKLLWGSRNLALGL